MISVDEIADGMDADVHKVVALCKTQDMDAGYCG